MRRSVFIGVLALCVAAGAGWQARRSSSALAAAPADGVAVVASAAAAALDGVQPAARAPVPGASVANPALPADDRAELARRMKADWCGFGAAEEARQTASVHARATAQRGSVDLQALEEVRQTVGGEVMAEAMADARRRWMQALTRRGDERSLAMVDYLGGDDDDGAASASAARARLQARARRSTDPMVTALALQRGCAPGACVNVEAAQWSRLEPGNLDAWLALLNAGSTQPSQAAYALDRLAQEARYSRSYQREMYAALMEVPQTHTPGLATEAETRLAASVVSGWPLFPMRPLLDQCRSALANAGTLARCEAVARLMVQHDSWIQRALGLAMARAVIAARPDRRPAWEATAQAYEAVQEWARSESERLLNEAETAMKAAETAGPRASPCADMAETRRMLHDTVMVSEWERRREGMDRSGLSEATLAARWRQREGRSVLDPMPASRPASASASGR